MNRVLFVGHCGDRSGAPLALLHLLRWLRAHSDLAFELLLWKGGELEAEFREVAPLAVVNRTVAGGRGLLGKLANRLWRLPRERARAAGVMRRFARRSDIDLVYFHSVASVPLAGLAAPPSRAVVCSVHELKDAIEAEGLERVSSLLRRADRLLAVSRAAGSAIAACDPLLASRVEVVPGCIPVAGAVAADPAAARVRVRQKLGIEADACVVGGCGHPGLGKGTDLFVQLAARLDTLRGRPVHFVWVGGSSDGATHRLFEADAARLGCTHRVHFPGPTRQPAEWFAGFDLFALPSRQDAFPLVVLEAAANSLPVVCFEGAGGAPEFVTQACGATVPYLDVVRMAEAIRLLASSPSTLRAAGRVAAAAVRRRHDVDQCFPRVAELIVRQLKARASAVMS